MVSLRGRYSRPQHEGRRLEDKFNECANGARYRRYEVLLVSLGILLFASYRLTGLRHKCAIRCRLSFLIEHFSFVDGEADAIAKYITIRLVKASFTATARRRHFRRASYRLLCLRNAQA